ncbi:hypothetical protein C8R46DRAFT_522498 [Mycena filopes]|nr:hypothetical protein C8R46DRAFT_522498 [Mycena filopes]
MKFSLPLALLTSLAAATTAYAGVVLNAPLPGATLHPGSNFTVEIETPNGLTPTIDISVAIGLLPCGKFCPPGDPDAMGTILYHGPYTPQLDANRHVTQNFTLTIPSSFSTGPAQLNVARFALIGAGPFPDLHTLNITVEVA